MFRKSLPVILRVLVEGTFKVLSNEKRNMEDIEDALQYYTAIKFKLDIFVSAEHNLNKAAIPQLPGYTTAELPESMNMAQPQSQITSNISASLARWLVQAERSS